MRSLGCLVWLINSFVISGLASLASPAGRYKDITRHGGLVTKFAVGAGRKS
jgi:hypothetical protein